jgi:hypothetical protein
MKYIIIFLYILYITAVGDIELRMNLEQNVEFQRFNYFDRELFQVRIIL